MIVAEIRERLKSNLQRVDGLVALFDVLEPYSAARTDVLRASIVLTHATLEDVFRSALELRLPDADDEHLAMLKFPVLVKDPKDSKKDRISMKDHISMRELAKHRGKSVNELIGERIDAYLERSNFNSVEDLVEALKRVKFDPALLEPCQSDLEALISRRHWIVHRADHEQRGAGTLGPAQTRPIDVQTVRTWRNAVETVCAKILAKMEMS